MQVGDLVNITETRGTGSFKKFNEVGLGVILKINENEPVDFQGHGMINFGPDIIVSLMSGGVDVFCAESVEVVSASR